MEVLHTNAPHCGTSMLPPRQSREARERAPRLLQQRVGANAACVEDACAQVLHNVDRETSSSATPVTWRQSTSLRSAREQRLPFTASTSHSGSHPSASCDAVVPNAGPCLHMQAKQSQGGTAGFLRENDRQDDNGDRPPCSVCRAVFS